VIELPYKEYPKLLVGEIVTDHIGIEWKRTNIRDIKSLCDDNYYYMPVSCYCDEDVGAGYTYSDEWGDCDHCLNSLRQIKGDNSELTRKEIGFDFNEETLFDETIETSIYLDEKNYEYKHFQWRYMPGSTHLTTNIKRDKIKEA
jgi:hypothetical protein